MARPSDYTPELTATICAALADGHSLRTVCQAEDMPDKATVFRWLAIHEEFRDQYARAREQQADAMAEEILEISDDATNDWMERLGPGGQPVGWVVNGEHVQRSRLRVDSRKWLASKMAPKKYGDKLQAEHTGADGGPIAYRWIDEIVEPPAREGG